MRDNKNFNALKTLTEVAKLMESSTDRMIRLYDPEFTASGNADERSRRKPDNQLISAMEPQLREQVDQLGRFLKTTPLETLLFVAVFAIQLISNNSVDTRDISRYLDINGLDFLPLKPVLHSLLKKRLIRVVNRRRSTNDYIVADTVEHSLLLNKPVKRMKAQEMDQFQFCNLVSGLIECRSNEDFDTRELFIQVEREEEANPHIKLVKELRKLSLDIEDRTLFYEICDDFVRDRRRNTGVECTLNDIYDNLRHRFDIAKNIMSQSHPLMQSELAELLPAKFLAEAEITLTEKGKRQGWYRQTADRTRQDSRPRTIFQRGAVGGPRLREGESAGGKIRGAAEAVGGKFAAQGCGHALPRTARHRQDRRGRYDR